MPRDSFSQGINCGKLALSSSESHLNHLKVYLFRSLSRTNSPLQWRRALHDSGLPARRL
jgi:hypothetical protein